MRKSSSFERRALILRRIIARADQDYMRTEAVESFVCVQRLAVTMDGEVC